MTVSDELLQKARTGDPDARDQLVEAYLPTIGNIASSVLGRRRPPPDLTQEGVLALLCSIDRFDPSFPATFRTFASARIRGAILDYLRRESRFRRSTTDEPFDHVPDDSTPTHAALADLIPQGLLSEQEEEVVTRYFGFHDIEQSQGDIAEELGMTQRAVSYILSRALLRLRIMLDSTLCDSTSDFCASLR